jgi:hypothetical protein
MMKRVFITANDKARILNCKSSLRAFLLANRKLNLLARRFLFCLVTTLSGVSGLIAQIEFECHTENLGGEPERGSHCWPDDLPPCESTINYAPNPDFPVYTPIKYIKFVLHVFQNPNAVFPPGNFTNSQAHLDVLRSWFHHPAKGMNARMAYLCDPQPKVPGNESPFIPDSRVRFLFDGIESQDVFFYEDPVLWGGGYYCGNGGSFYDEMYDAAVTNNPAVNSNPDILNSVHVFLAGASASNSCVPGYWSGGYTLMFRSCGELAAEVGIVLYGNYYRYIYDLTGQSPDGQIFLNTTPEPGNIPYGGNGILAEWLHMASVDHPGPNSHIGGNNPATNDGCADTPFPTTANNLMDTPLSITDRCALTECQLGRMHHFLEALNPIWVRTEENGFVFPAVTNFCDISQPNIIIPDGGDVVWNTHRNLRSNVIVEPGGRLTIRCDLGLPENARITVKPGARLIIDGARLFNNCPDSYWDGIIVEGLSGLPQGYDIWNQTYHQGYLEIRPGSIIERAGTAVECQVPGNNSRTGGVVQARGATFRNCRNRFVYIRDFQNTSPGTGQHIGNAGFFIDCSFVVDEHYMGDFATNFWDMVRLKNVDGIRFTGCNFLNKIPASTTPFADDRKFGIYAVNAGFSVTGKCNSISYPCTDYTNGSFSGLNRGIYSSVIGSAWPFSVSNTDFSNNLIGIDATGVDNVYIVDNNFYVGSDQPPAQPSFGAAANRGIMLFKCTGYKIENNSLFRYDEAGTTNPVGILIYASGEMPNEIYRNNFSKLDIGNLSNGRNRHHDPSENIGLQYLCNANIDNAYFDFAVPDETGAYGFGIRGEPGEPSLAAGNTFSSPGAGSDPELHIHNRQNNINYFYFNQPNQTPTLYTPIKVTPVNTFSNNLCPSRLPGDRERERDAFRARETAVSAAVR